MTRFELRPVQSQAPTIVIEGTEDCRLVLAALKTYRDRTRYANSYDRAFGRAHEIISDLDEHVTDTIGSHVTADDDDSLIFD